LEADLYLHGTNQSFRVGGEIHGHIGCECGDFDPLTRSLGFQPIPFSIWHGLLSPELRFDNPDQKSVDVRHIADNQIYSHRGHRRRYYIASRNSYLDARISNQIRAGADVLKDWHDVLGLTRDNDANHVTIDNSHNDAVCQGIRAISLNNQGSQDIVKATAPQHFAKIYETGCALLVVRNRIADVGFRNASRGNRVRLLRQVQSYTRRLRHSCKEIKLLKANASAQQEEPPVQTEGTAGPRM
jgi:hypothetical protein